MEYLGEKITVYPQKLNESLTIIVIDKPDINRFCYS